MRCPGLFQPVPLLIMSFVLLAGSPARAEAGYVEGEVLVGFRDGTNARVAEQVAGRHSLHVARQFRFHARKGMRSFGCLQSPTKTTAQLMTELRHDPAIRIVEPNYLRSVTDLRVPSDLLFPQLWGLENTGQFVNGFPGSPGADIEFLRAWGLARVATNPPVVAVVDTGVDHTHPDLIPAMWVNPGEIPGNGIDDDGNGYVDDVHGYDFADGDGDPADSGTHGTHVAGTVAAAGNNAAGVIGVAFGCKVMALKVSSSGDSIPISDVIEAIQYATAQRQRGVNVVGINASFVSTAYSILERVAIQDAGDEGILVCAAAGNASNNNDVTAFYPASYSLDNIIAVAATDQNDELADFSNFGATSVDLAAPGVNIVSTLPLDAAGSTALVQQSSNVYTANALDFAGTTSGITASIHDCGLGYPTDFPAAVSGNIALIERGTLLFSEKVSNAMAAGAAAAVIYNNNTGNFFGTLGTAGNWIPALSLSQSDGQALLAALPSSGTVINGQDTNAVYQLESGTSMAAPHVAGAVAFAALNFPAETVFQRKQRLLTNTTVLPNLQGVVRTAGRLNLANVVDTDGNGLPDWWEEIYFGQLIGTEPNADPDGDRMTTLAEWQAGTNPTNPASVLKVSSVAATRTNGLVLRWPSVEGRFYRLLGQTGSLGGPLQVLQTHIAATPPVNTQITTNTGNAHQLYRLQLEP